MGALTLVILFNFVVGFCLVLWLHLFEWLHFEFYYIFKYVKT